LVLLPGLGLLWVTPWATVGRHLGGIGILLILGWFSLAATWGEDGVVWESIRNAVYVLGFYAVLLRVSTSDARFERRLWPLFLAAAGVAATVHLYGYFAVHGFTGALWIPDSDRYSNQNNAARVFGVAVIVAGFYMAAPQPLWGRILAGVVALLALLLCLLTHSASALGALLLVPFCLPLLAWGRRQPLVSGVIYAVLAGAGVMLLAQGGMELVGGWSRRDVIWIAAIERLADMPFYGFGVPVDEQVVGADGKVYGHLHNLFFSVLLYSGYPGLLLLLGYVTLLLVRVIRFPERGHIMLGALLLYGLLALFTSGKYPLTRPNDAWLLFWVPLLLLSVKTMHYLPGRDSTP
jgi:hypothetical protein